MPWAEKDMTIVLKEADAARLSLPLCGVVKEVIKTVKYRAQLADAERTGGLNYSLSYPGRSAARAKRSGALQTRDRQEFSACGGPGSAVHRFAPRGATRCTASGTRGPR